MLYPLHNKLNDCHVLLIFKDKNSNLLLLYCRDMLLLKWKYAFFQMFLRNSSIQCSNWRQHCTLQQQQKLETNWVQVYSCQSLFPQSINGIVGVNTAQPVNYRFDKLIWNSFNHSSTLSLSNTQFMVITFVRDLDFIWNHFFLPNLIRSG